MCTIVYAKVQINGDTHGEVMFDIGIEQGYTLSHSIRLVH